MTTTATIEPDEPVNVLRHLIDTIKQLQPPKEPASLLAAAPFIRRIDLSPRIAIELERNAQVIIDDGSPGVVRDKLFGIPFSTNAALPDHFCVLRFADGRIGIWDMRTKEVRVMDRLIDLTPAMSPLVP